MEGVVHVEDDYQKETRHKYASALHDLKFIINEIGRGYRFDDERAEARILALQNGVKTLIELQGTQKLHSRIQNA